MNNDRMNTNGNFNGDRMNNDHMNNSGNFNGDRMNNNIIGSTNYEVGKTGLDDGVLPIEWATSDFGHTLDIYSLTDVLTKPTASSPWAYHADFP